MQGMRRLALTGTPGSGKSTVSEILRGSDLEVLTVESIASENGAIGEIDPSDGARPIDIEELVEALRDCW